jgi:hypothetical protein
MVFVVIQHDGLFLGFRVRVARIRIDANAGDSNVLSTPLPIAKRTLEVGLTVIKSRISPIKLKFGVGPGASVRVRRAVASHAAAHPYHRALLCNPPRVHLRAA